MTKEEKNYQWFKFIAGAGHRRLVKVTEMIKKILFQRNFKRNKSPENLILAIRLEHFQISKHQKLCMQYVKDLENLINKDSKL